MYVKDFTVAAIKAGPDDGLEEGRFTAYASVFGNVDSYGDVVVKGAFSEDLRRWKESGNPIPLLFGHQMSDPDFNLGYVAEAVEDDHGLLVTAVLDLENPKAAQVYRMLKGRRVNQMSFAYDVEDSARATLDGRDVNELRRLKVFEVSVVTIGANQETEILAVKAATGALIAKAGRVLSAKNEAALKAAHQQLVGAADEIKNVLAAVGGETNDQEKASGTPEAKSDATDEEPSGAKSSAFDEEPRANPFVEALAVKFRIYAALV